MRKIEYGDILFVNIPDKGYMRHYKKIVSFHNDEYLPNIKYYEMMYGKSKHNTGKAKFTFDFRNIQKYIATRIEISKGNTLNLKDLIIGDFYFSNFSNPHNKAMAKLLKNYYDQLEDIRNISKLVTVKKIRNKSYYHILANSENELINELRYYGFNKEVQQLDSIALTKSTSEHESNNLEIAIPQENLTASLKIASDYQIFTKEEPIGSTIPTVVNKTKFKIKKSKRTIGEINPSKKTINITTVERKQNVVQLLKNIYENTCQICDVKVEIGINDYMSEVHHIKPLGKKHNGPDIMENMIVVCPNHHTMLDRGAIALNLTNKLIKHVNPANQINGKRLLLRHVIAQKYVDYHNEYIYFSNV